MLKLIYPIQKLIYQTAFLLNPISILFVLFYLFYIYIYFYSFINKRVFLLFFYAQPHAEEICH